MTPDLVIRMAGCTRLELATSDVTDRRLDNFRTEHAFSIRSYYPDKNFTNFQAALHHKDRSSAREDARIQEYIDRE